MRVNERPDFSQKEARSAEKYVPRKDGTLRKRRRKQRKATSFEASLGGKDLTLTFRGDNCAPFRKEARSQEKRGKEGSSRQNQLQQAKENIETRMLKLAI